MPFEVMSDANDVVRRVVPVQRHEKILHPIYYARKILNVAQKNYIMMEQKLLVVVFSFKKFRVYLFGTKVIVHTDHTTIRYLMEKKM